MPDESERAGTNPVHRSPAPSHAPERARIREELERLEAGYVEPCQTASLYVSASCNLRCGYCWNAQGTFGRAPASITSATGRAVIDFLVAQGRSAVSILLFGGEPLMHLDRVREILEYARERSSEAGKPFTFSINTNGTLLEDRAIHLLADHDVDVLVSLDGDRETHDRNRPFQGGGPSFDRVTRGLRRYTELTGRPPRVRATLAPGARSWIETFEAIRALGVLDIEVAWSFGGPSELPDPRMAWPPAEKVRRIREEVQAFAQFYVEYLAALPESQQACIDGFFGSLLGRTLGTLHAASCSVHRGTSLAFSTDGGIYSCAEGVAHEHLRLGDVLTGISNTVALRAAAKRALAPAEECTDCWLRYLCSGGCFIQNHSVSENRWQFACASEECEIRRATYEIGVAFLAELARRAPRHYERLLQRAPTPDVCA